MARAADRRISGAAAQRLQLPSAAAVARGARAWLVCGALSAGDDRGADGVRGAVPWVN